MPPPDLPDPNAIPEARVVPHKRWSLRLVWLVPLAAALIGVGLGIKALRERGPTVRIAFASAEGIEAQKTRVKFRNMDIGRVTEVNLSEDRQRVVATVEMSRQAQPLLVSDTRFWIVRPRISATQVSGLGTLFSGAYIGMEAGQGDDAAREFEGTDTPPAITGDRPGRRFTLHAADLGSLEIGSPVYFRRVQVGTVIAHELDVDGAGVKVQVFVNSPHDRHVKVDTRFWQASGFDVTLDANGLRMEAQSLGAVLIGGVAFMTPDESAQASPAPMGQEFALFANEGKAMRLPDTAEAIYHVVFDESVRGLSVGAPIDFRGVVVGEVSAIGVDFDASVPEVRIPVTLRLYPDRLRGKAKAAKAGKGSGDPLVERLVERGLRAQLRMGSLLTGQLFVALDYFPEAPAGTVRTRGGRREIPAVAGRIEELQDNLLAVARKIDKLPLDALVGDARTALQALQHTLGSGDKALQRLDAETLPQATRTLADVSRTLTKADALLAQDAPLQGDVRDALREVARAAEALRNLADYLERHPDALLRGRRDEAPR